MKKETSQTSVGGKVCVKPGIFCLLALVLCLLFTGCGSKAEEEKTGATTSKELITSTTTVEELYGLGLTDSKSTIGNGICAVLFKDDECTTYVKVVFPADENVQEEYNELDIFADDYREQVQDFYTSQKDVTVTNVSNMVPSASELEKYAGKTVGDMEAEGFERTGHSWSEGSTSFDMENGCCEVWVEINGPTDSPEDMSDEEIAALEVANVTFMDLSWNVLDEELEG